MRRYAILVLVLGLAACKPGDEAKPADPPPVKDTAFGDMTQTMDKARGVEATTMQHKEDADRTIEATEQGADH